jgi:hypothetical protein
MREEYSTGSLAQAVARIATQVQDLLDLVADGTHPDGDARAAAAEIVDITKSIDSIRADLLCAAKVLRRGACIILALQDLANATGQAADLAAFVGACGVEALDYLVALRKAGREGARAFYLECHGKASVYKVNP